eukprot:2445063-Alexandrium_andersonii.AAC.1
MRELPLAAWLAEQLRLRPAPLPVAPRVTLGGGVEEQGVVAARSVVAALAPDIPLAAAGSLVVQLGEWLADT